MGINRCGYRGKNWDKDSEQASCSRQNDAPTLAGIKNGLLPFRPFRWQAVFRVLLPEAPQLFQGTAVFSLGPQGSDFRKPGFRAAACGRFCRGGKPPGGGCRWGCRCLQAGASILPGSGFCCIGFSRSGARRFLLGGWQWGHRRSGWGGRLLGGFRYGRRGWPCGGGFALDRITQPLGRACCRYRSCLLFHGRRGFVEPQSFPCGVVCVATFLQGWGWRGFCRSSGQGCLRTCAARRGGLGGLRRGCCGGAGGRLGAHRIQGKASP